MTNNLLADVVKNPALGNLNSNTGIDFFGKLIPNLIGLSFVVAAIIFFFMLIMGAIEWMSSGGDKGKVESARGRIGSALIGIVVLFCVFAIIKVVETFFGISILSLDISKYIIQ